MKMSWFFGKKKHKDSPPESTAEEASSGDQSDDFVVIEKRRTSLPPNVNREGASNPGLYPSLVGGTPVYPAMSTGSLPKLSQQVDAPHYLSGVPFKLCKELQNNSNDDLDIDGLRISEILSFVERLENQNYDYDFTLEESVITEMDSRNTE